PLPCRWVLALILLIWTFDNLPLVDTICCPRNDIICKADSSMGPIVSVEYVNVCKDLKKPRYNGVMPHCGVSTCNVFKCACTDGCRESRDDPPGFICKIVG